MNTDIVEGNILMAEFEGRKFIPFKGSFSYRMEFSTYKECQAWIKDVKAKDYFPELGFKMGVGEYHTSWDWLMPVWKKCIEVIGLWAHTHKEDRPSAIWLEASEKISRAMSSVDIQKTFTEITHLITWYNQTKQS